MVIPFLTRIIDTDFSNYFSVKTRGWEVFVQTPV
jgi:hypothetical protein